ncbi:hypothetical protein AVEN_262946-1 [Araneus ventricosus]|uniref:Uncharacterized protein n=1 Tax=Araneus ventricosus TaxID=182803 RepID=A0A4Y2DG67_ARAVE|nr:hypothetical protein AVEN_262946-1 [Araneus ventricosus]
MNSRRFPSPRKPLWKLRFTTQTPSLTLARPKIRLARIEPTKPAGADVVVRVLKKWESFSEQIKNGENYNFGEKCINFVNFEKDSLINFKKINANHYYGF